MMSQRWLMCCLLLALAMPAAHATEELITSARNKNGDVIPYVLNHRAAVPRYVVILFPGGNGEMNPRMKDGALVYAYRGNFVIRTRPLLVDDEVATVATNASQSKERIQAVIDDINSRFPGVKIYLMGTSKGTFDTMHLAEYLSERIAGVIHSSSLSQISTFNATAYKNRHLIVHHKNDGCFATPFSAAEHSHKQFGSELIAMEGGKSVGDPCEPYGHHGFNGIEKETIEAIKGWIKKDR